MPPAYGPYGETTFHNPDGTPRSGEGADRSALGNPYLYTGRRWDPEIALYYYRARYYEPRTGRFSNRDYNTYYEGNWNRYRAFNSSPLVYSDPTGLCSVIAAPPNNPNEPKDAHFDAARKRSGADHKLSCTSLADCNKQLRSLQKCPTDCIDSLDLRFHGSIGKNQPGLEEALIGRYEDRDKPGVRLNRNNIPNLLRGVNFCPGAVIQVNTCNTGADRQFNRNLADYTGSMVESNKGWCAPLTGQPFFPEDRVKTKPTGLPNLPTAPLFLRYRPF